jgi:long-chain acyl-CoA synthetase
MAVGGFDMPYVCALVTIDFDNTARWAEKHGISFTTMLDLAQKQNVHNLVGGEIERVNKSLPANSRVRRFVILNKAFDADEAELTRTRKLRRRHLEQRYGDILSAIYAGEPSITIQSEVMYQDGRTATRETDLIISDVNNAGALPKPEAVTK